MLVKTLKRDMVIQKEEFRAREEAQARRSDGLEEAVKRYDIYDERNDGDDEETSPTIDCTHFYLFLKLFLMFLMFSF